MPFGAIEPLFAGLGPTSLGWLLADHAERLPGWQADSILGRLDRAVFAGDSAGSGETTLGDGHGARSGNGDADHNRSLADDRAVGADEEGDAAGDDHECNRDDKADDDKADRGVKGDRRVRVDLRVKADRDVSVRSARTESDAFNRTEDVDGASAQRIAERTARYGTWLPAGLPDSEESDGPAEAAVDDGVRIWVGTPLRVVRGLDRATIDLRNSLAYDGLLVSDRDLAVRRNAARAPRGALPRGPARPCRRRRGPRLRRRSPGRPSVRRAGAAGRGRGSAGRRPPLR